ncbi:MAG: IS256 family transposase [Gemmatimonadetes bacterium]|nr:IS256 family transposase [Gemmatimonadota bacterium]MYE91929.1 IS256 family transposase [Gemmatimonadota bacterium]MYJ09362.1 IS256 family transposase [Gemmatimonadota bacterium]
MARERREGRRISDALLDELLAGEDPAEVFREGTLIADLKKAVAERALDAEMDAHLEGASERELGNHRNGHNRKRVLTDDGAFELAVPRDRAGRFEPQLVERYCRRLPGFDDKVISMYARGMTTREIRGHVTELYGVTVSAELISKVTDAVLDEVAEWRSRPLEEVYAIVYFDAVRVKIRDEGLVRNKAVYLAIGVTCSGRKEVLGLWIAQTEGAKFWLSVMNELKARGVMDVLIAVVDGLRGFPDAIEAVFPQATVQTCIMHLIRRSLAYASYRERRPLAAALKTVYRAPTEAAAETALAALEAGPWGKKYPAIARSWRSAWEHVVPFLVFSEPIRRAIYTTNTIESLNGKIRRAVRTRGHFPNDRAATKLIYLALRDLKNGWRAPPLFWHLVRPEFAIRFGERYVVDGS